MPGLIFAYLFLGFRLPPSAQAGLAFLDSLAHCPHCRACLAEHEALQRRIRHSLLADLRKAWPSAGMTFSAIAPSLEHPNSFAGLWQRASQFVPGMTALAALAGLVLAVIGLFEGIGRPAVGLVQMSAAPLPVAACFLFAIPVIGNYYESRIVPSRLILSGVLAFISWVGTAIVGLYEIFLVRKMLFSIYARFWYSSGGYERGYYWRALALGNWALIPLAVVWIALVVGGGEYHYKRVGQRSSWKLFGWTIAAELSILILPLVV